MGCGSRVSTATAMTGNAWGGGAGEGGAGPVRGGAGWGGGGGGEQHCAKMQALVTDNVVLRTL